MKPSFGPDSYERSSFLTNGVADLMTSLAVIFILLFAAYVTRVEDGNVKPDLNRTDPWSQSPGSIHFIQGWRPKARVFLLP